jgi:DNA repair ATPase RecN
MPSQIRANPTNGTAEIFHTDSQLYVQAVAMLQVLGGLEVALTTNQANSLQTIATSISKLQDIVNASTEVEGAVTALAMLLANIDGQRLASIATSLNSINTVTTASNSNISSLNSIVNAVNSALNTLNTKTDSVVSKTTSLDTTLAAVLSKANLIQDYSSILAELRNLTKEPSLLTCQTLNLAVANQQYSITIPVGVKRFSFGCRGDRGLNDVVSDVRYSMAVDQVAPVGNGLPSTTANYGVLNASFTEEFEVTIETARTIYFAAMTAGTRLLIRWWS